MKLHIQNMVSSRCIMVVKDVVENLGLHCKSAELGVVEISESSLQSEIRVRLKSALMKSGL